MIVSVGTSVKPMCPVNIGTHNGIFHCDEVVGVAILSIVYSDLEVHVVRTRDVSELSITDINIDVGGGSFDHHMAGFNQRRPTGEKYASAGLVWKYYAEEAIEKVVANYDSNASSDILHAVKSQIDREIILPIDMEDNGEKAGTHMFSFITKFLPVWFGKFPNYESAFFQAEMVAERVLREIIKEKYSELLAKKVLDTSYALASNGILEIYSQTMPWVDEVIKYNEKHDSKIKFVIFPYPAGGWAAQCVPPSSENKFGQIVPFPEEWAGGNEKTLPEISGIRDACFCHNGRFFARAGSIESVIRMCEIAMAKAKA